MHKSSDKSLSSKALVPESNDKSETSFEPKRLKSQISSRNSRRSRYAKPQPSRYIITKGKAQKELARTRHKSDYNLEPRIQRDTSHYNLANQICRRGEHKKRTRINPSSKPNNTFVTLELGKVTKSPDYQQQEAFKQINYQWPLVRSSRQNLPHNDYNSIKKSRYKKGEDTPDISNPKESTFQRMPQPPRANLYIHDKYAVKYTPKQVDSLLRLSKYSGRSSGVTIWLLFICVAVTMDYLKYDGYLCQQSTYEITSPADAGLVSSPKTGQFGWVILVAVILVLHYLFTEGFTSRFPLHVILASVTIILIEILIIFLSLSRMAGRGLAFKTTESGLIPGIGRNNIVLITIICFAWLAYQTYSLLVLNLQLNKIVKSLDFPEEVSSILRRAGLEEAAAAGTQPQ